MRETVRRVREQELPRDVERIWFMRGFAWGASVAALLIWAAASGALDAGWRALFGGN